VLVALKSVAKPGLATVESLKGTIDDLVRNEKKAEIIKAKVTEKDLNSFGSKFGIVPSSATGLSFASPMIPNIGAEPKIIGKIFATKAGQVSDPIAGESGVCMVSVKSITPGVAGENAQMMKQQLAMSARSQVSFKLMESLKKSKKVTDNRYTFY
jgi:peptidyl-prolyl cis-trans isomerase D